MKKGLLLLFLFLWVCTSVFSQTELYVSTKGSDINPGTKEKPFASIQKAIDVAWGKSGAVDVVISRGTYYLNRALVFSNHIQTQRCTSLKLINRGNDQVIISGGKKMDGLKWIRQNNGIWYTHIKNSDLLFDQLFVNGVQQRMARYPNFNSSAHYYGGTSADAISKERASRWKSPQGGYIHALHCNEWGDLHYIITGKDKDGNITYEGGWQNNRRMGMHAKCRFVENVFEELDTVNEWYFDKKKSVLYFYPPKGLNPNDAIIESPQLASLIEFKGNISSPLKNITVEGIHFTHTVRTFMQNKEPLLRSDWTIYRGGAIVFGGAENCNLIDCDLTALGGNALFFDKYNRHCKVQDCLISDVGASAVCFVGDPKAVRSPSFEYNEYVPLFEIDRTPGPKSNNYPDSCIVEDNLIFNIGTVEKQSAGVNLSMCKNMVISHNTIYDVPRAGLNVCDGTWGGHIIEYNDVFNTVKESGDHGSFNSWGRDRYWHPNKELMDSIVLHDYALTMLDAVKPIIIRNNRMRCDHGWDIDLDDGSSNYRIYNNLCLNGGIKLREGVNRIVENNIIINNTFHPHVWFVNSNDVFRHNIVAKAYQPVNIKVWGKETDENVFMESDALTQARERNTDYHSIYTKLSFVDPIKGNFNLRDDSEAFKVGFKNFDMDSFGVTSQRLKAMAKRVTIPILVNQDTIMTHLDADFYGMRVKNITTLGERSATGLGNSDGVLIMGFLNNTCLAKSFKINDVILLFANKAIKNISDLLNIKKEDIKNDEIPVIIFRNQKRSGIIIKKEDLNFL